MRLCGIKTYQKYLHINYYEPNIGGLFNTCNETRINTKEIVGCICIVQDQYWIAHLKRCISYLHVFKFIINC